VFFLRFLALVALAVWIGGLTALGVAAPTLFEVLQARDALGGRETAAVAFGAIFGRFQYIALACGMLVLFSLGTRAILGPRPRRFGLRSWTAAAMLAATAGTAFVIAPRIDAIRTEIAGPIAAQATDEARIVSFRRLHTASNVFMLATLVAGVGLVWTELRDPH
jgi:hypothetical protein